MAAPNLFEPAIFALPEFSSAEWLDAILPTDAGATTASAEAYNAADAQLSASIVRLQLLWQDSNEAAEAQMSHILRSLPRAKRDLESVRKQLATISVVLTSGGRGETDTADGAGAGEALTRAGPAATGRGVPAAVGRPHQPGQQGKPQTPAGAPQQDTAQLASELEALDRAKTRLEAVKALLQRAAQWEALLRESDAALVSTGSAARGLQHVAALARCAQALRGMPDAEIRTLIVREKWLQLRDGRLLPALLRALVAPASPAAAAAVAPALIDALEPLLSIQADAVAAALIGDAAAAPLIRGFAKLIAAAARADASSPDAARSGSADSLAALAGDAAPLSREAAAAAAALQGGALGACYAAGAALAATSLASESAFSSQHSRASRHGSTAAAAVTEALFQHANNAAAALAPLVFAAALRAATGASARLRAGCFTLRVLVRMLAAVYGGSLADGHPADSEHARLSPTHSLTASMSHHPQQRRHGGDGRLHLRTLAAQLSATLQRAFGASHETTHESSATAAAATRALLGFGAAAEVLEQLAGGDSDGPGIMLGQQSLLLPPSDFVAAFGASATQLYSSGTLNGAASSAALRSATDAAQAQGQAALLALQDAGLGSYSWQLQSHGLLLSAGPAPHTHSAAPSTAAATSGSPTPSSCASVGALAVSAGVGSASGYRAGMLAAVEAAAEAEASHGYPRIDSSSRLSLSYGGVEEGSDASMAGSDAAAGYSVAALLQASAPSTAVSVAAVTGALLAETAHAAAAPALGTALEMSATTHDSNSRLAAAAPHFAAAARAAAETAQILARVASFATAGEDAAEAAAALQLAALQLPLAAAAAAACAAVSAVLLQPYRGSLAAAAALAQADVMQGMKVVVARIVAAASSAASGGGGAFALEGRAGAPPGLSDAPAVSGQYTPPAAAASSLLAAGRQLPLLAMLAHSAAATAASSSAAASAPAALERAAPLELSTGAAASNALAAALPSLLLPHCFAADSLALSTVAAELLLVLADRCADAVGRQADRTAAAVDALTAFALPLPSQAVSALPAAPAGALPRASSGVPGGVGRQGSGNIGPAAAAASQPARAGDARKDWLAEAEEEGAASGAPSGLPPSADAAAARAGAASSSALRLAVPVSVDLALAHVHAAVRTQAAIALTAQALAVLLRHRLPALAFLLESHRQHEADAAAAAHAAYSRGARARSHSAGAGAAGLTLAAAGAGFMTPARGRMPRPTPLSDDTAGAVVSHGGHSATAAEQAVVLRVPGVLVGPGSALVDLRLVAGSELLHAGSHAVTDGLGALLKQLHSRAGSVEPLSAGAEGAAGLLSDVSSTPAALTPLLADAAAQAGELVATAFTGALQVLLAPAAFRLRHTHRLTAAWAPSMVASGKPGAPAAGAAMDDDESGGNGELLFSLQPSKYATELAEHLLALAQSLAPTQHSLAHLAAAAAAAAAGSTHASAPMTSPLGSAGSASAVGAAGRQLLQVPVYTPLPVAAEHLEGLAAASGVADTLRAAGSTAGSAGPSIGSASVAVPLQLEIAARAAAALRALPALGHAELTAAYAQADLPRPLLPAPVRSALHAAAVLGDASASAAGAGSAPGDLSAAQRRVAGAEEEADEDVGPVVTSIATLSQAAAAFGAPAQAAWAAGTLLHVAKGTADAGSAAPAAAVAAAVRQVATAEATLWLQAAGRAAQALLLAEYLRIPRVETVGFRQLRSDAEYLAPVLRALNVPVDPLLARYLHLVALPTRELSRLVASAVQAASRLPQGSGRPKAAPGAASSSAAAGGGGIGRDGAAVDYHSHAARAAAAAALASSAGSDIGAYDADGGMGSGGGAGGELGGAAAAAPLGGSEAFELELRRLVARQRGAPVALG
jgi:hypothetical protein